ncbi:MAG: hypothetical protein ACTSPY_05885 [Candidatus Helarchaeota archaeon]
MKKAKNNKYQIRIYLNDKQFVKNIELRCMSCKNELNKGDYIYYCVRHKKLLCYKLRCLMKHAGHIFYRIGIIINLSRKSNTNKMNKIEGDLKIKNKQIPKILIYAKTIKKNGQEDFEIIGEIKPALSRIYLFDDIDFIRENFEIWNRQQV